MVPFNNPKANVLKHWLRNIKEDFFAGNDAKINWSLMPCSGSLTEIFRSENALRTIAAYNTHENFNHQQYGETFQLTFGALAAKAVETGVDECNLGRFAWMKFKGRNGHTATHCIDLRPMPYRPLERRLDCDEPAPLIL
jgi:hypothetical protein